MPTQAVDIVAEMIVTGKGCPSSSLSYNISGQILVYCDAVPAKRGYKTNLVKIDLKHQFEGGMRKTHQK